MIISADYLRRLRPVAGNIEPDRLEKYIDEAEKIDILPAIGARLYQRLANIGIITINEAGTALTTGDGSAISVGSEGDLEIWEQKLLNGGYYTSCSGEYLHFEGLKKALGYLAYARFVRNHSAQVTPFGVVVKSGDESSPADSRMIAAIANDALQIGKEHLSAALRFLADQQNSNPDTKRKVRRRFLKVGE